MADIDVQIWGTEKLYSVSNSGHFIKRDKGAKREDKEKVGGRYEKNKVNSTGFIAWKGVDQ